MTVTTTSTKTGTFSCDGSVVDFPFTFPVQDQDELNVYLITAATGASTLLTRTTDYTVALVDDGASGGTVTTNETYSSDYEIVVYRDTTKTQTVALTNGGAWLPDVIETALDKMCMLLQDLWTALDQALQLTASGDYYDAGSTQIRVDTDPSDDDDLARKGYVDTQDAATYSSAYAAAYAASKAYTDGLIASLVTGGAVLADSYQTTMSNGDTYLDVPYAYGTFDSGLLFVGGSTYDIASDCTLSDDGSGNTRITLDAGAIVGDYNVILVMFS